MSAPDVPSAALQRVRHLCVLPEGFKVTVLSAELATAGKCRRFQSGVTIGSHLEAPAQTHSLKQLVFDTHVNALRYGRADAKRCIADLVRQRIDIVAATPEADQAW